MYPGAGPSVTVVSKPFWSNACIFPRPRVSPASSGFPQSSCPNSPLLLPPTARPTAPPPVDRFSFRRPSFSCPVPILLPMPELAVSTFLYVRTVTFLFKELLLGGCSPRALLLPSSPAPHSSARSYLCSAPPKSNHVTVPLITGSGSCSASLADGHVFLLGFNVRAVIRAVSPNLIRSALKHFVNSFSMASVSATPHSCWSHVKRFIRPFARYNCRPHCVSPRCSACLRIRVFSSVVNVVMCMVIPIVAPTSSRRDVPTLLRASQTAHLSRTSSGRRQKNESGPPRRPWS